MQGERCVLLYLNPEHGRLAMLCKLGRGCMCQV